MSQDDILKQFEAPSLESLDQQTQRRVSLAQALFTELSRLMKSITLYGAQHQSTVNFRERFSRTLSQALDELGSLSVDVLTYALTIAEQVVYEDPKIEGNFIYKFYTDGLRQLTFTQGVSVGEVDRFLDLCLTNWSDPQLFEDDAVTQLWEARFEHISYRVAPRYDEGTAEAEEHLFSLSDELARLQDVLNTCPESPAPPPFKATLEPTLSVTLKQTSQLNDRELLEKLITIARGAYQRRGQAGRDKALELIDQVAQLFAQSGDISALERFMRQALSSISRDHTGALSAQQRGERARLISRWATPLFVQRVMAPLKSAHHEQSLSALSCLQLLGAEATPHLSRALEEVAEQHMSALTRLVAPHLSQYAIELARNIRQGGLTQATRLVKLAYQSGDVTLARKVFEAAWAHEDRGVRDEALRSLPEALRDEPVVLDALFEALQDPSSKIRSFAFSSLSQPRGEVALQRLEAQLDAEQSAQLEPIEQCKLYAAAALAGVSAERFEARLEGGKLALPLGKSNRYAALVGLACASKHNATLSERAQALLSKEAGRLMASSLDKEAARWGGAFLQASEPKRAELTSSLMFRGVLSV